MMTQIRLEICFVYLCLSYPKNFKNKKIKYSFLFNFLQLLLYYGITIY
jgi:hypothetical protein